jgi:hypothetical protein
MYKDTIITAGPEVASVRLPTSFRSSALSLPTSVPPKTAEAEAKLARLVEGLSKLLADEVAQIKADPAVDTASFADSKAVYLLELNRMMRLGQAMPLSEQSRDLILVLRERLSENQQALRIHLEASRSVAETIKRAIRQAESDGTYEYGTRAGGNGN